MINTASYAERLIRDGEFTPKQAAALAQQRFEIEESMMTKADLANLATKQDIHDLRLEIASVSQATKQDINGLRLEIADVRSDLKVLKWGIAIVVAAVVIPHLKQLISVTL